MAVDRRTVRFGLLITVSMIMLTLLGTRLWFLQGLEQAKYQAVVSKSKTKTERLAPERGRIFDTKGRILADNRHFRSLTVEWSVLKKRSNRDAMFRRLAPVFGVTEKQLQQRYDPCYGLPSVPKCTKRNPYSTLVPMPLIDNVSESQINFVLERKEDFPGVDVTQQWERVYYFSPLASHIVGFMGAITKETKDAYVAKGYNLDERVGQFGVELSMEDRLHGKWGSRTVEVDALGNVTKVIEETPAVAGDDIQLTIDLSIQQYADQALDTQLHRRRNLPYTGSRTGAPPNPYDKKTGHRVYTYKGIDGKTYDYPPFVPFKAPAGAIVVENYTNGEIIAMASYPTFDNRWFSSAVSSDKLAQIFPTKDPKTGGKLDPDKSTLVNRAVQGNYNLGSSIKPFIAWSALDIGLITASTWYNDTGTYKLRTADVTACENGAKCEFKNAISKATRKPAVYGPLRVNDALAVSSDAFFYNIGEDFYNLNTEHTLLKSQLTQFGFGVKSGIELPFEWGGRIPDNQVKKDLVARGVLAKNEVPRLVVGDNVQAAIGQGLMAATPLQLVNAYATLANGGNRMTPTIIKKIYAPGVPDKGAAVADLALGRVIQDNTRGTVHNVLAMPPDVRDPIINGLHRVITGPGANGHGTTGELLFKGFRVRNLHGKTGTVQGAASLPWNDSSAFGSFVLDPDKPYAVVAYLEKSGYGAQAAGPVVKCMYSALYGMVSLSPVHVSDPLDITSTTPAPTMRLPSTNCLNAGGLTIRD